MSDKPKLPQFFYIHTETADFIILSEKTIREMRKGAFIKTPMTNIHVCTTPNMQFTLEQLQALVDHSIEGNEAVDPELVYFICQEAHTEAQKRNERSSHSR